MVLRIDVAAARVVVPGAARANPGRVAPARAAGSPDRDVVAGTAETGGGGQGGSRGGGGRSGSASGSGSRRPSGQGGNRQGQGRARPSGAGPDRTAPAVAVPAAVRVDRTIEMAEEAAAAANRRKAILLCIAPGAALGVLFGIVAAVVGQPLIGVLVLVVVAVLGAATIWLRRARQGARRHSVPTPSVEDDHPRLHNLVDGLCATMGLRPAGHLDRGERRAERPRPRP